MRRTSPQKIHLWKSKMSGAQPPARGHTQPPTKNATVAPRKQHPRTGLI